MNKPAITLDVLPAGFGDCLLVTCSTGHAAWRMLIDTGPDENYPALRRRLLELPLDQAGKRHIDLFVVTHIDHDHIGGAHLLLNDDDLKLSFGDIWFNAPDQRRVRGVREGQSLAALLGAKDRKLPWNQAWGGKPVVTPALGGGVELTGEGAPRITLLSPTPERLDALFQVWAKELEKLRKKEREPAEPEPRVTRGARPNLEALAAKATPLDRASPNGSSIALLVEHQGASVVLAGDAFADVLVPALQALAKRRGLEGPLKVDAFKLSHHGSRANVTVDLLQAVAADHFVVSTDNRYFRHPNDEALARVVTGGESPTIWFNYDTPRNRKWDSPDYRGAHGYRVRFPEVPDVGVSLELHGHAKAN